MIHTEKQIEEIALKLLSDIDREYLITPPIEIELLQGFKPFVGNPVVEKAWEVRIPVHDDMLNTVNPAYILVFINDSNGEIIEYIDGGGGRPIPLYAEKDPTTGKYILKIQNRG